MPPHYRTANVARVKPGIQNTAYIAMVKDFTTLAVPAPAATGAARFEIADDHVFTSTKGFMECILLKNENDFMSEMKGDPGASWQDHTINIAIPGDGPLVQSMIHDLQNEDLIILVKDTNCPDPKFIQFGCECDNAQINAVKLESGKRGGDKDKQTVITLKATCRFDYLGTLTLQS